MAQGRILDYGLPISMKNSRGALRHLLIKCTTDSNVW